MERSCDWAQMDDRPFVAEDSRNKTAPNAKKLDCAQSMSVKDALTNLWFDLRSSHLVAQLHIEVFMFNKDTLLPHALRGDCNCAHVRLRISTGIQPIVQMEQLHDCESAQASAGAIARLSICGSWTYKPFIQQMSTDDRGSARGTPKV